MPCDPLQELKPLDLTTVHSVASLVGGLSLCSFGARMLGEATAKFHRWLADGRLPTIVYERGLDASLESLLQEMVARRWVSQVVTQREYAEKFIVADPVVVLGAYSPDFEASLSDESTLFINPFGLTKPHQVTDGYYPNVVFSDPRFVMPVIFAVLEEKLLGRRTNIVPFIEGLSPYGGLATQVARGARSLLAMISDPDCTVILTLSGAMTIAKMGLVLCDVIDHKLVQGICSTGALMAHGLVESIGLKHYKYDPTQDDSDLAARKLNRVTDTLEPESNLEEIKAAIMAVLDGDHRTEAWSPRRFHQQMGKYLTERYPQQRGLLKSAYEQDVPVFVPAFHDSEIGNTLYVHNLLRKREGKAPLAFNQELDTEYLLNLFVRSSKLGIFTVGGGVPRNYVQNVPPLIDIINESAEVRLPEKKFTYGCRICPDPPYYGHLSGCTYSEGVSWRKMHDSGYFSEIRADATLVLPFLIKYVLELTGSKYSRYDRNRAESDDQLLKNSGRRG
ncbi:MAG: deoxyhypusine synthase family protein [Cyanophyceae cyanobacterium]